MLKNILNHQSKSLGLAAMVLGITSVFSGLLSLLRVRLLASRIEVAQTDVYLAAFRIPDFVYSVLIAGGIISIFLPVFSEYYIKSQKEGWRLTSIVFNWFLIFLSALCLLLFILAPLIIGIIVPGFSAENKALTVTLTRMMLASPIFFVLSSVFSGVLHYFNRFLAYSFAPILYNLGIISGILFFVPKFGILGLGYGVILGAFLYFLVQAVPVFSLGFKYDFILSFKESGLKKILFLGLPRIFGAVANNINLTFITAFASTLALGSISVLNYSQTLQGFPVILVGISFATAAFPRLAKIWVQQEKEKFLERFSSTFRKIFFLAVPIAILMFALRAQAVQLIFGNSSLNWQSIQLCGATLGIFAFGIFSLSLMPLVVRTFYSFQNTKTPVLITFLAIILDVIFVFSFVFFLSFPNVFHDAVAKIFDLQNLQDIRMIGLPLAITLSDLIQLFVLLIFLYRRIGDFNVREIINSFKKVSISAFLMLFFIYFAREAAAYFVNIGTFLGTSVQAAIASFVGIVIYFISAHFLKLPELKTLRIFIFNNFRGMVKPSENGTKTN